MPISADLKRELHWVFPKIGVPQNGWFIMENPWKIQLKWDDLGGKPTIFGNIHLSNSQIWGHWTIQTNANGSSFGGVCATFQQPPVAHWRLLFLQISCLILRDFPIKSHRTQRHHEASAAPKSVWEQNFYLQRSRMAKPILRCLMHQDA